MNIIDALQNQQLFGDAFTGDTWEAWRSVLSGAFAIPMDDDRLAKFKHLAGGREPPSERVRELWCIAGRRSAKTHTAAGVAVYLGTVSAMGLTSKLSAGEKGVIAVIATDRSQARIALNYISGILDASPVLRRMVVKQNTESVELSNAVVIEVSTSNFKAIRGRTLLAVILDEVAFFTDSETSTSNDKEIYRAAVPGLATTGGLLIGISSPYAKRGLLYEKFRKHFASNGDVLVVKGATTDFNPTMPQKVIDDALADDPESAKTEWLGEFRDGISSYVDRTVVESCARQKPLILPPVSGIQYQAFVDPAGGGSGPNADQFTMGIGYADEQTAVVCGVWARRGSPAEITAEYADILKTYRIKKVKSDRYAGAFPREEFERNGISLEYTKHNRSQLYAETLPLLNTGRISLPPDPILINQICGLERRTGRGADIIDHAPGQHDDLANSVAGLAVQLVVEPAREVPKIKIYMNGPQSGPIEKHPSLTLRGRQQ